MMQAVAKFADFSRRHPGQVVSMGLDLNDVRLHEVVDEHPWLVEMGGVDQLEQCAQAFAPWAAAARLFCMAELGGFSFWIGNPLQSD